MTVCSLSKPIPVQLSRMSPSIGLPNTACSVKPRWSTSTPRHEGPASSLLYAEDHAALLEHTEVPEDAGNCTSASAARSVTDAELFANCSTKLRR